MGLLLPAVQSAREAGRRNTCTNNISQLAKATIAYDGKFGAVPGWRNPNIANSATGPTYSWPVALLPNLERSDIYNRAEADTTDPAGELPLPLPQISIFLCPSAPPSTSAGLIAYAGNCGNAGLGPRGCGVFLDRASAAPLSISLDFISAGDGTSNTLAFAERSGSALPTLPEWGASQSAGFLLKTGDGAIGPTPGVVLSGTAVSGKVVNAATDSFSSMYADGTTYAVDPQFVFPSSNHTGGVTVAFCDGHTVFLKDSIAPCVLSQLMTSKSINSQNYNTSLPLLTESDFR